MRQETGAGTVVAFRNDRLGARLNAMLSALRISRAYGGTFRVYWALSESSSVELQHPEDLFSKAFMREVFLSREEGMRLTQSAADVGMLAQNMTAEQFRTALASGQDYLVNAATAQPILPWESPDDLAVLPQLIGQIGFSSTVKKMLRQIDAQLAGVSFRSYHLRRGDIIDDRSPASHNLWPDKYIPRVIYEWHMKRELDESEGKLLVFSDASQEAEAFASLSPRISTFDSLIGEADLTPLQRDFLELYTMSRSERIYAPPSSAFSGMAAVIGNKSVTDISSDLSDEARAEAFEELAKRLEKQPDMFLSKSDMGQNLPFVAEHLDASGQQKRLMKMLLNRIEDGLDRSYVYSFLAQRLLQAEAYDDLDRLVDLMPERACNREEHWSSVYQYGAVADMARGNWGRACQRYHVGSWFTPLGRQSCENFWYLASRGVLTPENTYPFDPGLLIGNSRIFTTEGIPAFDQLNRELQGAGSAQGKYPCNIEIRDWRAVQGKKLNMKFGNKAKLLQQVEMMQGRLTGRSDPLAVHGALGVLLMDAGQPDAAREHLRTARDGAPDRPLYLKRLAECEIALGRVERGLAMMERACAASGDHVVYRAALALACLGARQHERYFELACSLREAPEGMIELSLIAADAMRRRGDTLKALPPLLESLRRLSSSHFRVLQSCERMYERQGDWQKALDALLEMLANGRPESMMRAKIDALYELCRKRSDDGTARELMLRNGLSVPERVGA